MCSPAGLRLRIDDGATETCSGRSTISVPVGEHQISALPPAGKFCQKMVRRVLVTPTGVLPLLPFSLSCSEGCRTSIEAARKSRKVSKEELACLESSDPKASTYLSEQLLLSEILADDLQDLGAAAQVLTRAASSPKGRYSAELHYRRARFNYLRTKNYRAALKSADLAWQNRNRFSGKDPIAKMLDVRLIQAGASEQIFYASGDTKMERRAREMYERILEDRTAATRQRVMSEARAGLKRISTQQKEP